MIASSGNIRANVSGSTVGLFTSSGVELTGTVTGTTFSGSGASLTNINGGNISTGTIPDARIASSSITQHQSNIDIVTSQVTSGTFADARIASSSITQHQSNIDIVTSQVTSGTFADARISSSSITQHQANITAVGTLASLTTSGNVVVGGNLTVNGTTTTVNSTTLDVADLNITIADGAADSAAANGAGLTVNGANATFTYTNSGDKWNMNKSLDIGSNTFTGNGSGLSALNASNLSTGTIPDARIQASGVTQHEASLTITESQISDLGSYITASSTDTLTNKSIDASQLTGTVSDARLPSSISSNITGTAALATNVTITANNSTNETVYLTFVDGASGTQGLETDTGLSYNPSTNILSTTATSAQYADLAEKYTADRDYDAGTVLVVGGDAEVTICTKYTDSSAAGVVSTNPAHLMNSDLQSEYVVNLALTRSCALQCGWQHTQRRCAHNQ